MKHKKDTAIVYIITHLELGGAQKVCLSLFQGVAQEGITTYLIAGQEGVLAGSLPSSTNIILLNTMQRAVGLRSFIKEIQNFFSLIKILRELKKKHAHVIVHTHSTKAGIVGRWAAFFSRIVQRVHTIHGFAFHQHQSWLVWLPVYLAELVTSLITTHFVCVSSADVKMGIRLFPRFAKKHSIIRAAVDWKQFYKPAYRAAPTPLEKPFVFGTISCFKKQKNLFDLLNAFKKVHETHPKVRLEIIGDGVLRPAIESWIAEHQLQHVISLHGWQEQVAPFMMQWHAFVLSSLWEGLPCAIVEARLLHLPVISYDTGGIHDVIMHGHNGFLYKQGDWYSLAHGMLMIVTNQNLYRSLRDYQEDLHDFNDQCMIAQHTELYQQL